MINKWHAWLGMRSHTKTWYEKDMVDEINEYSEELKLFKKWSELSDVVYVYTRSKWNGHELKFPFKKWQYYIGIVYMLPKYTDRWLFYRIAGRKAGAIEGLHEVRNPKKTHKLHHIAKKNSLNEKKFQSICEKQLKYWPLLP